MKRKLIPFLLLSSALFISQNVAAARVYQWTDADGVVHFSDAPPADAAVTATREIQFDDFATSNSNQEKYTIIDQANIMANWRRQHTEDRLAVKRLHLEEQYLAQELELSRLETERRLLEVNEHRSRFFVFPQQYFHGFHRRHVNDHPEVQEPLEPRPRVMPPDYPQAERTTKLRVGAGL